MRRRCDWCGRDPRLVRGTPAFLFAAARGDAAGLMYNQHQLLCWSCHWRKTDRELARFAAGFGVQVGRGLRGHREDYCVTTNRRWVDGVEVTGYGDG